MISSTVRVVRASRIQGMNFSDSCRLQKQVILTIYHWHISQRSVAGFIVAIFGKAFSSLYNPGIFPGNGRAWQNYLENYMPCVTEKGIVLAGRRLVFSCVCACKVRPFLLKRVTRFLQVLLPIACTNRNTFLCTLQP